VSIWSALCSVYRVCILSLIVIISCTNLHNWNNCLHRQHSVYYDVFYCLGPMSLLKTTQCVFPVRAIHHPVRVTVSISYVNLRNSSICCTLRNLFISICCRHSVLCLCYAFIVHVLWIQYQFSCPLSFHCLHFLHRFTLSEYFAVFINWFIAICCMQHIRYVLLFFYRQHHFGQRLCCVLHVLRFTSCFNEFATLRHSSASCRLIVPTATSLTL